MTILTRVDSGYDGLLENTARTTSATPDPNPGNNTDGVSDVVGTSADVSLTKAIAPTDPVPGQPVTFTLVVHNAGPSTAKDVAVTDPMDKALTPTAATADDGSTCTTTGGTVRCSLGDLKPGATVTITVTADLAQGFSGNLANTAAVTSPTPDPDLGNNVDTVEVGTAPVADLRVRKTVSPGRVVAGGNLSYVLTVRTAVRRPRPAPCSTTRCPRPHRHRYPVELGRELYGRGPGRPVPARYRRRRGDRDRTSDRHRRRVVHRLVGDQRRHRARPRGRPGAGRQHRPGERRRGPSHAADAASSLRRQ